jgi:hypothetical protein
MAKKSNANAVRIVIAAVVVVLIAGYAVMTMQRNHREAVATAAAWMITGPACPTPAAGARPSLSHQTNFEEVAIAREVGGAATCNTIRENGNGEALTICQFIAPGALRVTTAKGTFDFAPPHGIDASVVVRGGVPACVLHVNPALFKD